MTAKRTFHIPARPGRGLALCGHFAQCGKCKRKVLVEMPLIGVPHHTDVLVTCADCLVVSDSFKTDFPEQAKQIEEWLVEKP